MLPSGGYINNVQKIWDAELTVVDYPRATEQWPNADKYDAANRAEASGTGT